MSGGEGEGEGEGEEERTLHIVHSLTSMIGTFHLGRIQARVARGIRIAQGNHVEIVTKRNVPAQVDGEPWVMVPSTVSVRFKNRVQMLQKDRRGGLLDSDGVVPVSPRLSRETAGFRTLRRKD
jgi:hypothetical protein